MVYKLLQSERKTNIFKRVFILTKDKVESMIYSITTEGMVPDQWLEMLHSAL